MNLTRLLRQYLGLAPRATSDQIQMAYHKSAHIVFAYKYGYSCHRVDLKEIENIDIHYKEDLMLVAGILSYSTDPVLFESLPEYHKRRAVDVTLRLINMLYAGYMAQSKSIDKEECAFTRGKDLFANPPAAIDRLQIFLQSQSDGASHIFRHKIDLQSLAYFITKPQNWKQVDRLAKALLYQKENTLDQLSIEKILGGSPVVSFREEEGRRRALTTGLYSKAAV